jgi:hypothetical protein
VIFEGNNMSEKNNNECETSLRSLLNDGYELVYQSGHQNVYCNGEFHKWSDGGWAGNHAFRLHDRISKCNCEDFSGEKNITLAIFCK